MEPAISNRTTTIHEHIIDISRDHNGASSNSNSHSKNNREEQEELSDGDGEWGPPSSSDNPVSNLQNTTFLRTGEGLQRRHCSPLNSGLWISVELVLNLFQIVAKIVLLSLSKHEHPHAPLFEWVIGYTAGCVATLPHLYWGYVHRNRHVSEQEGRPTAHLNSSNSNNQMETNSYTGFYSQYQVARYLEKQCYNRNPRIHALVDHFKMALDSFFAVRFVVIMCGFSVVVRLFLTHPPNLYWLCIAFLTFSCIGYAMPFILCAMICCCLPCINSLMGFREDLNHIRGANQESINALPIYKFRVKRINTNSNRENSEIPLDNQGADGAGTDKERMISAEDAEIDFGIIVWIIDCF